jgi:ketosteroid isomerase-like protein
MMRQSSLLALVFLMVVTPTFAQPGQRAARGQSEAEQKQQIEDDKAAIQKLHDADIDASLALDTNALEALWTDDIVTMAPGAPPVVGREANTKRLEAEVAKLRSTQVLAFDEQWQEVRIEGDWAYEWGSMSGRLQPFSGGKETDYKLNVVRILNRQPDGTWKIARSIYNDAEGPAKAEVPVKPEEPKKDRLKD